ncbi:MAG: hypothetical protein WD356_06920 [Pseudomonadales bacterium]
MTDKAPQRKSAADIISQVRTPNAVTLSCSVVSKGIDNYHVDVEISKSFVNHAVTLIEDQVARVVADKRLVAANTEEVGQLREMYRDMMEVSLHRIKTDLKPAQFSMLQFAVIKFVVQHVKFSLDSRAQQLEETLAQQQYSGSRNLLPTQERFAEFRRRYDEYFYHVNRFIMRQLHRVEMNHLRPLRAQLLGEELPESLNIMFNPMLSARTPGDPLLLMEHYVFWPGSSEGFNRVNVALETYLGNAFKELNTVSLRSSDVPAQTEVYDELGGHLAVQPYLGTSVDQQDQLQEDLCWLEHPGHIRLLFDETVHEKMAARLKDQAGMKARMGLNAQTKKLRSTAARARKEIGNDAELKRMIASYMLREDWSTADNQVMGVESACEYIAGVNTKKHTARIDRSKQAHMTTMSKLDALAKRLHREFKNGVNEKSLAILSDWSRYRLHLKYFRFAHRVFNRINVVTDPEQAQLSRAGGHLYWLVGSDEMTDAQSTESQIVHHTVLKADVRGSTRVTQELIKNNLNPASYFSLRFFDPINELLSVYGAVKVFIEGDAVILGIYEYDDDPQGWYSVSRACGIAREMLDIVNSKNTHSRQTGLPALEIGIGICYADDKPQFLFDEQKPIMISPAIGAADRLSSCSWPLRDLFQDGDFNVEVLKMNDGAQTGEAKGQNMMRYNLNGILLDQAAFEKLQSEITLRRLNIEVGQTSETMHVGRFPDLRGKERELVVREGRMGRWQDGQVIPGEAADSVFYEVLPNSRLASKVLEQARKGPAGT